jgi:hypothetical protein
LDYDIKSLFEDFLDDEVILEGDVADKPFRLTLEDILCFTGFSRGQLNFHVWGTLEEFIKEYKLISYDVWAEEIEEDGEFILGEFSEDWMIMTMALNYSMYDIQHLSLKFKPDLSEKSEAQLLEVERFVDFLLGRVDPEFFSKYQSKKMEELNSYQYSFTANDHLIPDLEKKLYPTRILKIMRKSIGSKHQVYKKYMEEIDEEYKKYEEEVDSQKKSPKTPDFFWDAIKFALGVKYGLIQLSENEDRYYECFDQRYENGELGDRLHQQGISTKAIFDTYTMKEWLYLIP